MMFSGKQAITVYNSVGRNKFLIVMAYIESPAYHSGRSARTKKAGNSTI